MVSTSTMRLWWSAYRCTDDALSTRIELFGRNAGSAADPAVDAFKAFEQALTNTGYTNVRSVWIPRPCPLGIGGKTCYPSGAGCSLHNYEIAVDLDPWGYGNPHFYAAYGDGWNFDDIKLTREQVEAVEGIRNVDGERMFRWLGWLIGDTMHFELQVRPTRVEVDWSTVPTTTKDVTAMLPLKQGDGGEGREDRRSDVAWFQAMLNKLGAGLRSDGIYGPKTSEAVARYLPDSNNPTGTAIFGNRADDLFWKVARRAAEDVVADLNLESGNTSQIAALAAKVSDIQTQLRQAGVDLREAGGV